MSRQATGRIGIGAAAMAAALSLASCVAPPKAPPPAAPPSMPAPPPPAPPPVAWEDLPAAPGTWVYAGSGAASEARFGVAGAAPEFIVRCDPAHAIQFERPGAGGAAAQILFAIRTSDGSAAYAGQSLSSRQAALATTTARDPLLDRIAFSRGHFSVAVSGRPMLVLPAWPEIARVIEDCRR